MRFLVLLIVLTFPVIDVLATLRFARWTGVPALAWMLASTVAGLLLLHHERVGFRAMRVGTNRLPCKEDAAASNCITGQS